MTNATTTQQHRSRLLPDDPTYLRLRDATARRLSASLQRLVRELRGAHQTDQHTALSAFITRQTAILQEAYIASYKAGAKDYYGETSMDAGHWAEQTPVNPQRMRQALAFYAPSIAKMAHQALGAVNAAPGMKLDELIAQADNTIRLFSFGPHFGARPTGGIGGEHLEIRLPNGEFAGRRAGAGHQQHESQRGIHEHLAAQHHGEGEGGGDRHSSEHSPNENALRTHVGRLRQTEHGVVTRLNGEENQQARMNIAHDLYSVRYQRLRGEYQLARAESGAPHRYARPDLHVLQAAKTTADVQTWLNHSFPGTSFHLGNAHPYAAKQIAQESVRLAHEHPTFFRQLRVVGNINERAARDEVTRLGGDLSLAKGRGVVASTLRLAGEGSPQEAPVNGYAILLRGPGLFGSKASVLTHPVVGDRLKMGLSDARDSGRASQVAYTMRHEFGHVIHFALRHAYWHEPDSFLGRVYSRITSRDPGMGGRQRISEYAASSDHKMVGANEQYAEAFAAGRYGKASIRQHPFVREMRSRLQEIERSSVGGMVDANLLAEFWDDDAVQLFSFGGFRVAEVAGGARGHGSIGGGNDRTIYGPHHQFQGSRPGEHNEASIHEHVAAQHHGEGAGAGGGRRLARPNEGAHRIERGAEHVRAIQRVAAAHANPALHAEPRLRELRQEAENATAAYRAASTQTHETFIQRSAAIRGDLTEHPTARITTLAARAARIEAAAHGPKAAALQGRAQDLHRQIGRMRSVNDEFARTMEQLGRIEHARDIRAQAQTRAHDAYRNAVSYEVTRRMAIDPAYRQAMEHEAHMDTARRNAVDAHARLAQEYRLATNELFRAQQNLTSIQEHSRLTSARATHHDSNVRPFTQEQFVRALESPRYGNVNTGVNDTRLAKINGREYIIKHIIHLDSRGDAQAQVAREVVTPQVGRLLGVGENMPAATYHMSHMGHDYVVVTREAGRSVISHDPMVKSEIADHYDGIAGQKLLMFEYLVGQGDRHEGNILYNEHNNRLTEIDFGLEYPHGTALLERSVVGRALTHQGHIPMSQITIHPSVVEHALSVEHEVLHALGNGGVHSHDIVGVYQRFAVLHDLWQEYQNTGEMTMHDWWRIGGDHEGYHEAASPPWASAHQDYS